MKTITLIRTNAQLFSPGWYDQSELNRARAPAGDARQRARTKIDAGEEEREKAAKRRRRGCHELPLLVDSRLRPAVDLICAMDPSSRRRRGAAPPRQQDREKESRDKLKHGTGKSSNRRLSSNQNTNQLRMLLQRERSAPGRSGPMRPRAPC